MSTSTAPDCSHKLSHAQQEPLAEDLLRGLRAEAKTVSPSYFYDARALGAVRRHLRAARVLSHPHRDRNPRDARARHCPMHRRRHFARRVRQRREREDPHPARSSAAALRIRARRDLPLAPAGGGTAHLGCLPQARSAAGMRRFHAAVRPAAATTAAGAYRSVLPGVDPR